MKRASVLVAAAALALSGCQSIPDMSEWNKATKDVTSAVAQGFQTSASLNGDIAKRLDAVLESKPEFGDPSKRYASVARALNQRADDYEKLFGAVADYSSALAAISKAADNSGKTAEAVAGSVNGLIEAVGQSALAGAGFNLAKLLLSELIKVKAASDFGDAVEKADPIIGKISELLANDLNDLKRTVGSAKDEAIRAAIEIPTQSKLDYRTALERRRDALQASVRTVVSPAGAPGATLPTGSLLNASDAPELGKIEQYLKDADAWYLPYKAELGNALSTRGKSELLVTQTLRAVEAWRESHASIAKAVKERRPPDSARLAALAVKIRELVDELKKGK